MSEDIFDVFGAGSTAGGLPGESATGAVDALSGAAGTGLDAAATAVDPGFVFSGGGGAGAAGLDVGSSGPGALTAGENWSPSAIQPAAPSAASLALPAGAAGAGVSPDPNLAANVNAQMGGMSPGGAMPGAPAGGMPAYDTSGLNLAPKSVDIPAAMPTGAPAAAPGTSVDRFMADPGFKSGWDVLKANPGVAIAGAGLGINAMRDQSLPGMDRLKGQADALSAQGAQLSSYLQSGQLPPGAQVAIDQATKSAKAAVRSKYAQLGMSGSTAEIQDLNNIDMGAKTQAFGMAMSLLKTGVDEIGLSTGIYESLLKLTQAQNHDMTAAIANFAAAASGVSPGLNLKLA